MLQPITFTLESDDGSGAVITASAPDYVAYEQRFNKSVLTGMQDGLWSLYMFIIWHAGFRQGVITMDWDAWLDTSPKFSRELKAEEPVPLDPAAPTGSSQP